MRPRQESLLSEIAGIILLTAAPAAPCHAFAVTAVEHVPPAWANAVEDPSFEQAKWTALEDGAALAVAARTGSAAARIRRVTEKENPRWVGRALGVQQGVCLLSGWLRSNATVGADRNFSAEVNLTWKDAKGRELGRSRGLYVNGVHPVWDYRQAEVIAPGGVATADIVFGFTGPIVGECELDDVVLSPGGSDRGPGLDAQVQVKLSLQRSIFDPGEQPVVRVELRSGRKRELPVRCEVEVVDSHGRRLGRGSVPGTVPETWRSIVDVPIHGLREGQTSSFLPVGEWLEARVTVFRADADATAAVGRDQCGLLVWPRPTDYALRPQSRFGLLVGHAYTKRWLGARWERPNLCNERLLELPKRYGVTCMPMFHIPLERIDEPGVADEYESKVEDYVRRHAPFLTHLQIGNEPPIFRPGVDRQYVRCLRIGYTAAKRVKPTIKIAAAGITGLNVDEDMVAKMLDAGAAPYCDLIDIHTYLPLNVMDRLIGKVTAQMQERGVDQPLIITEVTASLGSPLPEREKASHVVQRHAIAFAHGVAQVFWFVMHGISPRPGHWDYCGLIDIHNRAPWPAAAVYARLALELADKPFQNRERRGSGWAFTFGDSQGKLFIVWSDDDRGLLALSGLDGPVRVYDVNAREYVLKPGGVCLLNLTREPLLVAASAAAQGELVPEVTALEPNTGTVSRGGTLEIQVRPPRPTAGGRVPAAVVGPLLPVGLAATTSPGEASLRVDPDAPLGLAVPCFVQRDGAADMAFLRLPLTVTEPLAADLTPVPGGRGGTHVKVTIRNLSRQPLSGTADVVSPVTAGSRPAQYRIVFRDLPGESTGTHMLSLDGTADPLARLPFELTVSTESGVKARCQRELVFTPAERASTPVRVDGDLREWSRWPIIVNGTSGARHDSKGGNGDDSADVSAHAAVQWDDDNLYIAIRVSDDVHHNPRRDGSLWDGDSVQLGITPEPGVATATYCEYTVGLGEAGTQLWAHRNFTGMPTGPLALPAAVVRTGGLTCYELAIPWQELPELEPEEGTWLGFGLVLNDDDGEGRGWLGWHHGIASDKSPSLFGQVTLVR